MFEQVGAGSPDHSFWGRPEDMTMERPAMKIDASAPGEYNVFNRFLAGHVSKW